MKKAGLTKIECNTPIITTKSWDKDRIVTGLITHPFGCFGGTDHGAVAGIRIDEHCQVKVETKGIGNLMKGDFEILKLGRLTKKRAEYLWAHKRNDSIAMAFKERCRVGSFMPDVNGLTIEEDNHIMAMWGKMSGDSWYELAFHEIRKGNVEYEVTDEELRFEYTKTLKRVAK